MSLVCCGGLRTDFVITAEGKARLMEMGGNAIYSAAGARIWRADVAILGRIGDNFPRQWLNDLAQRGFDVSCIRNIGGQQDHRTFYAYTDRDTRVDTDPAAHFARIGVPLPYALHDYVHSTPGQDSLETYEPLAVRPEDLPGLTASSGAQADALHIAPISMLTQRHLPEAARARGIGLVSLDPGERTMQPQLRAHIEDVLMHIDLFLPSDQEVRSLLQGAIAQPDPMQNAFTCARWFAERGPTIVVIKLGSRGALVYERAGDSAWHVPALPVDVVDVTGAGDSFCGGFMAEYARSGNMIAAAAHGTVSASFAIQDYGTTRLLEASQQEAHYRAKLLLPRIQRW
jgi:sugar/nucleoside kinase (ribokinase family)